MSKKHAKYTTEDLLKAISGSAGIMSTIADRMQCAWHTARTHIEANEEASQALLNETEGVLDMAEGKLFLAVESGDSQMIKYLLSTKGKKRGYTERKEMDFGDDRDISIKVTRVKSD